MTPIVPNHFRPRVFCIGMNKTGTSSLNAAFKLLGLRSLHHSRIAEPAIARAIAEGQPLLSSIDGYDCYTDAPFYRHYQALDRQYPDSRFILNTRDTDAWVRSRIAHDRRWNKRRRPANAAPRHCDPRRLRATKERYELAIQDYFAAEGRRHRFLVLNVPAGDGWRPLCGFLGLPVPRDAEGREQPFPFKNRTELKT